MGKDHWPSIKNDEEYEALLKKAMSEQKAAKISKVLSPAKMAEKQQIRKIGLKRNSTLKPKK